jgi:hypothetical protein
MWQKNKREISKTTSGTDLPTVRTESAFDIACGRCGRKAEGREIAIELPKALGQKTITWTRLPDGWWQEGIMLMMINANCPGCMETPLAVPVSPAE